MLIFGRIYAWLPYGLVFPILCLIWKWKGRIALCLRDYLSSILLIWRQESECLDLKLYDFFMADRVVHWCRKSPVNTHSFYMKRFGPELSNHNVINFTIKAFWSIHSLYIWKRNWTGLLSYFMNAGFLNLPISLTFWNRSTLRINSEPLVVELRFLHVLVQTPAYLSQGSRLSVHQNAPIFSLSAWYVPYRSWAVSPISTINPNRNNLIVHWKIMLIRHLSHGVMATSYLHKPWST